MRGFHLSRAMALWLPSKPSQAQQQSTVSELVNLCQLDWWSSMYSPSSVAPYQNFLFICSLFLVWLWPSDTPSAWTKSTRMMRVSNPECFCLKCCDETFDASSTRVELLLCDVMIPARALGCIISIVHIDRLQNISNARLEAKNTLSASLYNPKNITGEYCWSHWMFDSHTALRTLKPSQDAIHQRRAATKVAGKAKHVDLQNRTRPVNRPAGICLALSSWMGLEANLNDKNEGKHLRESACIRHIISSGLTASTGATLLTRHKIANGPWQRSIRIIHAQTQKNCLRSRKASRVYSHQTLMANDTWPFTNHFIIQAKPYYAM